MMLSPQSSSQARPSNLPSLTTDRYDDTWMITLRGTADRLTRHARATQPIDRQ